MVHASASTHASLDALANDWKADVLRISMYIQEGGYETNPRMFTDLVHSFIELATARGMYAIVDWHMLTPGDPNFNLARAKTFFTEIAQRHSEQDEHPLRDRQRAQRRQLAERSRATHEQIIPVIRAAGPGRASILVGTRAWSSLGVSDGASETEVINNPVNATNIMYTFHFYAASHGSEYLNALSRAADRIPMFVTEFGTQTSSGDGGNNFTQVPAVPRPDGAEEDQLDELELLRRLPLRRGLHHGHLPGRPFAGTSRLKPAGVWVRDRIRAGR